VKTQLSDNFLATSSVQILGSKKRVTATSNNMSFALKKIVNKEGQSTCRPTLVVGKKNISSSTWD